MQLTLTILFALASTVLGSVILHRGNATRIIFSILCYAIAGWALINYFSIYANQEAAVLFFMRLVMALAVIQGVSFFLLIHTFPSSRVLLARKRLRILLAASLLTIILSQTPLLFSEIIKSESGITPKPGPAIILFVVVAIGSLISGFVHLTKKYNKSKGLLRKQLFNILVGTLLMFGSLVFFNFILTVLLKNPVFIPYSPLFTTPFILLTSYSIVRHRLLDIKVVISRSILYFLLLTAVSLLFTVNIFLVTTYFAEGGSIPIIMAIAASLLVVFGLEPFKRFIAHQTDRVFFKAPINYQQVLTQFTEKISLEVELDGLILELPAQIAQSLKLHHVEVLLADEEGNICRRDQVTGHLVSCLGRDTPLVQRLIMPGATVDRDGLERKIVDTREGEQKETLEHSLHQLEELDAYFVSPVTTQNRLNAAMVLGRKLSGDSFSVEELGLFRVLGPQIGSAIEKAKLFDEVKNFSQKLQIEVDRATRELKERNRFLLSLQEITSLITHSLDFQKVTQQIVDGIAKKLGYIGGILMLYDKPSGDIWAEAITQTAITRAAIRVLPKSVTDYRGNVRDQSKTTEAITTGEIIQGERLSDFISPAVPTMLADAIQKLIRVKHVVAAPIFSENEVIGLITFVLGKDGGGVSKQEIAMMRALADQAGIVMRNLRLFEAIQKANAELERANEHLRSLDQAKSEFISIASHQLRTPMTGIMGYLSMLVGGDFGKFDPNVTRILEGILTASKRMIRLINIFLNITKIEAGRFEIDKRPVQIAEIIETEFVELQKLAKDKGLKLKFDKPKEPLPLMMIDRDKMADVIQNLVDNAIKYTEKGSITVSTHAENGQMTVSVQDTGRGLKTDEAEKLFNKFVRGDGIARIHPDGSGLGLYIAKKIVEAHGGRVWVESEGEGKGSTFTFVVPVA
ncbi:MAG: GAF domain-containing protein [Candidatus Kerfeldbacteria bacterium]|nr:GAF domain-containing protein [Candidatus Kerfeldbacteria bacterium]